MGACAAYALECQGLASDIQIIDANAEAAEGEALDLLHGAAVLGGQRVFTGLLQARGGLGHLRHNRWPGAASRTRAGSTS